ncbi:Inositol-1-monophosphatase [Serinicoccus hydrothermalis]|uniref:Inositol-1-monophosphatase n=1 Tax=Serinicoccus hydrothermalis TaxID=1758689 RepID=A0A1B1N968_9MICO|nr:inositol monophosphatase [Serinicoccus hydrothermalis]ANS77951.1 Inositol-1-monophosphatase [Serinicoccus hydrothermalis]
MAALTTDAVLTLLQEVAEEVITPRFRDLDEDEIGSKSHPGDLVTVADREAEVLITRELRAAYPDAAVLGEEAFADDPGIMEAFRSAEHAFTVDPVDGTRNFVHGSPDHAVMVAETRGGQTVRSWIWQPQHRLAYVAERGAGATRNGERLPVLRPDADPARWRVRTSSRRQVGESLAGTPPMSLTWVSCGIDYPHLAEGACDALVYRGTRPWDHVPGALLVHEVGGVVATTQGEAYTPRSDPEGILATSGQAVLDRLVQGS